MPRKGIRWQADFSKITLVYNVRWSLGIGLKAKIFGQVLVAQGLQGLGLALAVSGLRLVPYGLFNITECSWLYAWSY